MDGDGDADVDEGRPDEVPIAETLDDVLAGDDSGLCAGLLDVLALLSDVGAARWLLRRAGYLALVAAPGGYGFHEPFAREVIDAALDELAEAGLVTLDEDVFDDDAGDSDDPDDVGAAAGEPDSFADPGEVADPGEGDDDTGERAADDPDDLDDDPDDLDESAFDTVTVDPEAERIILARHVAAGTIAELGARACTLLDEAARSGAAVDYALLADGMTACWDHLLPHLGAADDELVKDLLAMRGWGLFTLIFYPDVSEAGIIEFGEKLVADYEQAIGPGHPDAWETRRNMSNIYWRFRRYEEVIDGLARLRADMERVLSADDGQILEIRGNLARGYMNVGRYSEAVRECTELLADYERVLGPADNATLSVRGDLGELYLEVGRVAEGIALMEAAAAGLAATLGPDYSEVVSLREAIDEARGQVPDSNAGERA